MRFPVDSARLRFRIAVPARPDVDFTSGEVKRRDNRSVWVLSLTVMDGSDVEVIRVRTTDAGVEALQQDDAVAVAGLSVLHWAMGDRSGMSFQAESVTPTAATVGKGAATGGAASSAGAK
ncbi:hypothetical protein LG943_00705 [Streptomonospora sp. S1-112]|uniref:Regulatory protein n=1 Tax=Streptomonospora mangrovi TaxID=2883123 RepID=A0A9X3NIP0_9ACTN|nr:hypothetical protein [Streptomonospora mangrovi]MDA0562863.1 hypothetical protein [Streptomonospora mangrovi]